MQHNKQQLIIVAIVIAVLLVPAIIWIGMGYAGNSSTVKMPAISTIGPEMTPYVMTALEREKLTLPAWNSPIPMDFTNIDAPKAKMGSEGPYPGMTPAELDKLAQRKQAPHNTTLVTREKKQPVSTIENIPRVRGIEGLTPQERAKLEAYLKSQSK